MRSAAVGFQCPECVREGVKSVRPTRTAFGGRVTVATGRVTAVLIAVNVVFFLLQQSTGTGLAGGPVNSVTRALENCGPGIADGQYYRLITAAFLHGGLLHIAFNMLALYQVGSQLERLLGAWRYLTLYVVCAFAGNALSFTVHPDVRAVGASTALFGFLAAFYLLVRKLGGDAGQIAVLIGINLFLTFSIAIIDQFGHIGGLVGGALVGSVFAFVSPRKPGVQLALIAVVVLLICAMVGVRLAEIGPVPDGISAYAC